MERVYRVVLGALLLRSLRESIKQILPLPLSTVSPEDGVRGQGDQKGF